MFKLRVDWCESCLSCGTEIAVDVAGSCNGTCACPWCGATVPISMSQSDENALSSITRSVQELESRLNSESVPQQA